MDWDELIGPQTSHLICGLGVEDFVEWEREKAGL